MSFTENGIPKKYFDMSLPGQLKCIKASSGSKIRTGKSKL